MKLMILIHGEVMGKYIESTLIYMPNWFWRMLIGSPSRFRVEGAHWQSM